MLRQVGERGEMFRLQGFRDDVFFAKPFAEINQPATLGTKRAELACEPVTRLAADRAVDLERLIHVG